MAFIEILPQTAALDILQSMKAADQGRKARRRNLWPCRRWPTVPDISVTERMVLDHRPVEGDLHRAGHDGYVHASALVPNCGTVERARSFVLSDRLRRSIGACYAPAASQRPRSRGRRSAPRRCAARHG